MSGNKTDSKQSMNQVNKTPILHQPIFRDKTYKTKYTIEGLIRAFYIKLLNNSRYIQKVLDIMQVDYKYGDVDKNYLLKRYPDNNFIGQMMTEFLKSVKKLNKYSELIEHLNSFKLYDDILLQIFSSKIRVYVNLKSELN